MRMKVDTLGVEAFVAIADHGGFHKAADALHLTQTALTRRLQNLESLLGVTLVERTTRSVALTPTGRDFLPQGRRLLAELTTALVEIRETGKARRGDVSIACVPSAGVQFLPKVIERYSDRYPDNRIKILDHASSAVAGSDQRPRPTAKAESIAARNRFSIREALRQSLASGKQPTKPRP